MGARGWGSNRQAGAALLHTCLPYAFLTHALTLHLGIREEAGGREAGRLARTWEQKKARNAQALSFAGRVSLPQIPPSLLL